MKIKYLIFAACSILIASPAFAADFRVKDTSGIQYNDDGTVRERRVGFADEKRFYVAANFVESFWRSQTLEPYHFKGNTTSSFDAAIGIRANDVFRFEVNYFRMNAGYGQFNITGNAFMLNAIADARINNKYSFLFSQFLVPYVGIGAGASWNKITAPATMAGTTPVAAAMAGIAFEFNRTFSIDFGYRYFYQFKPDLDMNGFGFGHFAPAAHQLRVGAKINF
ncbi:MAG: porin family protein [Proteobacteria bacterium]|nr:porin family protein [Pseudomonadota bacterium]